MNEHIFLIVPTAFVTGVSILQDSTALHQQKMTSTAVQEYYPALPVPVLPQSHTDMRKHGVIPTGTHMIARLVPQWKPSLKLVNQAVKIASTYQATS